MPPAVHPAGAFGQAESVRNDSAQTLPAQEIGTTSIKLSQRKSKAFEVVVGGAHQVTDPEHHYSGRDEGRDEKVKQQAGRGARAPGGTVEHAVVGHELSLLNKLRDLQQARLGAFA